MAFKAMEVKEAFAGFLREQMWSIGFAVEEFAHKIGHSAKTTHNYLKPDQEPVEISDKFYTTMQNVLQIHHQDDLQRFENHHVDQSFNSISDLNISNGTFSKTVFGARDVSFHDINETED